MNLDNLLKNSSCQGGKPRSLLQDFSAVFVRVNQMRVLFKLWNICVESGVLGVPNGFLSDRRHIISVDG